jgi:hypothetical protein
MKGASEVSRQILNDGLRTAMHAITSSVELSLKAPSFTPSFLVLDPPDILTCAWTNLLSDR